MRKGRLWTRDELILTLDLFRSRGSEPVCYDDPAITELSRIIDRSRDAVYLSVLNFSYLDCGRYISKCKLARQIWAEFYSSRDDLHKEALRIKANLQTQASPGGDDGFPTRRQA